MPTVHTQRLRYRRSNLGGPKKSRHEELSFSNRWRGDGTSVSRMMVTVTRCCFWIPRRRISNTDCGISNRGHVHRQPCPFDGRGAENRQDNCVRSAIESRPPRTPISQTGTSERPEFLVDPGQQRCPHNRASHRNQPLALLCRPPRQLLPMGG